MLEKHPYLSVIYNKNRNCKMLVLIQLLSKQHISYYDINKLKESDIKDFFRMVIIWWNKTPNIPVSLYYKDAFRKFDYCKEYLENKEYDLVDGYKGTSLKNLSEKRIKRKVIKFE